MLCDFNILEDGHWQCNNCGWKTPRPLDKVPIKGCLVYPQGEPGHGTKIIEGTGDYLHDIIIREFGARTISGCGCRDWILQMNAWGASGCRKHREKIVDRMIEQAKKRNWKRENKSLVVNVAARVAAVTPWGEQYARNYCGKLVDEAIVRSQQQ